jgi:hypothetical protein
MPHPPSLVPNSLPAISGAAREIQPRQHLIGLPRARPGARREAEGVDAVTSGLYKTPQLAAGAIPPPLFF